MFNEHVLAVLAFFAKYPGIHSISQYSAETKKAAEKLVKAGYLQKVSSIQYTFTGKVFVNS